MSQQQGTTSDQLRDDKLDPQDPARRDMQPPIPTHPPDPSAAGDADKIVDTQPDTRDPDAPAPVNTGIGSGPVYDAVGGAGLGMAPGEADDERPATTRDRDTRAIEQQDRTRD